MIQTPAALFVKHLAKIDSFSALDSAKNTSALRSSLESLFFAVDDDSSFIPLAETFLSMACLKAENKDAEFEVEIERHSIKVVRSPRDLVDSTSSEFHYMDLSRKRCSWHRHFMNRAISVASRTTCKSGRRVGAVFVRDNVPLMESFNGVPPKYPHPEVCKRMELGMKSGEGLHLCPCNHAETNGIAMSARMGVRLEGCDVYVSVKPCHQCIGTLAVVKPRRIIYNDPFPSGPIVDEVAKHSAIELVNIRDLEV